MINVYLYNIKQIKRNKVMKAEFYKVRGTEMEEMMKRGKHLPRHLKMWSSISLSGIWSLQRMSRTALNSFKDKSKC